MAPPEDKPTAISEKKHVRNDLIGWHFKATPTVKQKLDGHGKNPGISWNLHFQSFVKIWVQCLCSASRSSYSVLLKIHQRNCACSLSVRHDHPPATQSHCWPMGKTTISHLFARKCHVAHLFQDLFYLISIQYTILALIKALEPQIAKRPLAAGKLQRDMYIYIYICATQAAKQGNLQMRGSTPRSNAPFHAKAPPEPRRLLVGDLTDMRSTCTLRNDSFTHSYEIFLTSLSCRLKTPESKSSSSDCRFPDRFVRQSMNILGWGTHFTTAPVSIIACLITCISIAVRRSFTKWSKRLLASTTQRLFLSVASLSTFAKAMARCFLTACSQFRRSKFWVVSSLKMVMLHASSLRPFERLCDSAAKVEFTIRCIFPDFQCSRLVIPCPFSIRSSWAAKTPKAPCEAPPSALAYEASVMTPQTNFSRGICWILSVIEAVFLASLIALFKSRISWTFNLFKQLAMMLAEAAQSGRPSLAAQVRAPMAALVAFLSLSVASSSFSLALPTSRGTSFILSSTNFCMSMR